MKKSVLLMVALLWVHPMAAEPLPLSPSGVKTLAPEGAIKPTGPWSLGTRAGDYIYIAGMRGITRKPICKSWATNRASAKPSPT